ncbi:acyltransferase-domain-containing protein [Morchella snyderi]|nr:acyltransferase-domain-containing protein [Morchella snyderi]
MVQRKEFEASRKAEGVGSSNKSNDPHPAGGIQYGGVRQFIRMCSFSAYFIACCIVVHLTQLVGTPLYLVNKPIYYSYMSRTKQNFGILVTTITQWWSPTVVRVTGDKSVRHQLKRTEDGRLECDFPERMILIANHQLYSDWLYLWWIAYTARLHGFLYIILKESLKHIPVVGWGMRFYGFIFLARKWEQDQPRFKHRLSKLAGSQEPMWLMIFPEGTNLSESGRNASAKYAEKAGLEDLRHLLLPRATGLRFCLENLMGSVEWVYDCTVAYEGIPRGKFGQDYFTLSSTYFQGRPPKSVNMHWRRFAVSSIPISDPHLFELWIRQRWIEKDHLLEHYMLNGRFPEDDGRSGSDIQTTTETGAVDLKRKIKVGGKERIIITTGGSSANGNWGGPIETEVKLQTPWEVLEIPKILFTLGLLFNIITKLYHIIRGATLGFT